ncbi:helix-turn-helix domain-containing protein [Lentilactobacillus parafarraginis]|uniref:helix-turn-helix domain-containing protein n=1 Tax=Lentilactobacillus parafarraginis TaxID=390842 RepID=UPI0002D72978|nr:helix-turn-helix transcriptional regulator [Lentilactobacillus parafarraginis]
MNLSKQIKTHREREGLSQEELAEKLFVSRQTISNWENDRTYPDIDSLLLLSNQFGISLDELVKGDVETMNRKLAAQHRTTWHMLGGLFLAGILVGPGLYFFDNWGLLFFMIPAGWSLLNAIKIERWKYDHRLRTYEEILVYEKGQPVPRNAQQSTKSRLIVPITTIVLAVILISLTLLSMWLFGVL